MLAGVNPTQYVTMMSCICLYQCVSLGMDKLLVRHTNDDPSVTIAVYLYALYSESNTICHHDVIPMCLSMTKLFVSPYLCLYDDHTDAIAVYLYAFWREFNTICLYDELPMSLSICLYDIIECITVRFNADLGEYITVSMALWKPDCLYNGNFDYDLIWTEDLLYLKRQLCQLSHDHCPTERIVNN